MAHNPPRPKSLDAASIQRLAEETKRPRIWGDLPELADWIEARAKQGKRVVLSPETALIVARVLRKSS